MCNSEQKKYGKTYMLSCSILITLTSRKDMTWEWSQLSKETKGKKRQIEWSRNQERYPLACLRITLLDVQVKPHTAVPQTDRHLPRSKRKIKENKGDNLKEKVNRFKSKKSSSDQNLKFHLGNTI